MSIFPLKKKTRKVKKGYHMMPNGQMMKGVKMEKQMKLRGMY
jgi:hypothetical protein